jgi:hypothetical protein
MPSHGISTEIPEITMTARRFERISVSILASVFRNSADMLMSKWNRWAHLRYAIGAGWYGVGTVEK